MSYQGDLVPSQIVDIKFTTKSPTTGAPATLTSGMVKIYKDNSTTESTAGITFSADFDSVTGLNNVNVDTSADGTFYSAGSNFFGVLTAGTVGGVSAIGYVLFGFSISNRSGLRPTTAGRTLDVSATGEAGIDWANIGAPTTSQNLSGTTISTAQVAASVAGNVGGNVTGSVGSVAGNVGGNVGGSVGSVIAPVTAGTVSDKTGYALSSAGNNAAADALLIRTDGIETGFTLQDAIRLVLSASTAELAGAATTTVTIRDINDTKNRITATVDANGNRTAVTYDVS